MTHSELLVTAILSICLISNVVLLIWMRGLSGCIRKPAILDPASHVAAKREATDALAKRLMDDLREFSRPSGGRVHIHDVEVILNRRRG